MSNSKTNATDLADDFGRNSYRAERFNAQKATLAKLASGTYVPSSEKKQPAQEQAIQVPDVPSPIQQPSQAEALKALGLSLKEETTEFVFATAENTQLRIKVQTLATTRNDDSISLLIPGTVEILPPKLNKFIIKQNDITYHVIYAGGVLQLGSMQMLSFVRVS